MKIHRVSRKEADHQGGQVHDTLQLSLFSCIMNVHPIRNTCGNERIIKQNSDTMYKKQNKTIIIIIQGNSSRTLNTLKGLDLEKIMAIHNLNILNHKYAKRCKDVIFKMYKLCWNFSSLSQNDFDIHRFSKGK